MLGCDLKLLGCDWLTAVVTLQKLAGVRGGELSVCYEAVAPFYNIIAMQHPLYIPRAPHPGGKGVVEGEGSMASGAIDVKDTPPGVNSEGKVNTEKRTGVGEDTTLSDAAV